MGRDFFGQPNGASFGVRQDSKPFPSLSSYLFTLATVILCEKDDIQRRQKMRRELKNRNWR